MTNAHDHARRPGAVRASRSRHAWIALAALGSTAVVALATVGYATGRGALLLGAVGLTAALGVALYRVLARPAMEAMRLALTDSVTGLGNTRHFLERLERDLDRADEEGLPLTLCLLDIDDFKRVNDHFGHPSGDGVLVELAGFLRRGGEAFRLGGDEFALLLAGRSSGQAVAVAEAVLERIASHTYPHGRAVTASAGIATYPDSGVGRAELVRAADRALYEAKSVGKDCVRVYTPNAAPRPAGEHAQRNAASLLEAARSLVRALATRGIDGGGRGEIVGDVAARIAARMGLSAEQVELVRIAGALNDVGKLALPDDVLLKPGPLTEPERDAIERHPEIGYAMLESLGADPLATWIRHHHERWDGAGYPQRLSGVRIPLGARILFVADAFEAMTSDQVWRRRLTVEAALAEIERCAGTQFDPEVVAALVAEYGGGEEPRLRLAG